ncbi:MAG: DUF1127 domain-containing protein [Gammaproteobacteria bacterium]|nr:DUF1127 domain-containing protein [Gammaproteobacteria bacterium]
MQIPIIQDIVSTLQRRYQRQVTVRELLALNERTLRDIGLHKDDIPSVVDDILNSKSPVRNRQAKPAIPRMVPAHGVGECLNCAA